MFVFKWIKGLLCSMFSFRTREEYLNYVKENLPKKEPLPENINKAIDDLYDISKNELNVLLETPSIDEEWLTKLATAENSILLQYKEKNIEFINLVEKWDSSNENKAIILYKIFYSCLYDKILSTL